jgi:hypothetical protein
MSTFTGSLTDRAVLLAMPSTSVRSEPQAGEAPGLVCIQDALGGVRAVAGVSSLRIAGDTKPAGSIGMRPLPGTREISVVFPDRYKRVTMSQPSGASGGGLTSIIGFDRGTVLSSPRVPDDEASMRSARQDFMRQIPMRLPRTFAGVSLSQRMMQDAGQQRLAIDVSGPDAFRGTLLADAVTCVPVAFEYAGSSRMRAATITVRVDLAQYREFGGVRFPTVLRTSHDGEPYAEEHVASVEVNAPGADQYFAPAR